MKSGSKALAITLLLVGLVLASFGWSPSALLAGAAAKELAAERGLRGDDEHGAALDGHLHAAGAGREKIGGHSAPGVDLDQRA